MFLNTRCSRKLWRTAGNGSGAGFQGPACRITVRQAIPWSTNPVWACVPSLTPRSINYSLAKVSMWWKRSDLLPVCACVCLCECVGGGERRKGREREGDGGKKKEGARSLDIFMHVNAIISKNIITKSKGKPLFLREAATSSKHFHEPQRLPTEDHCKQSTLCLTRVRPTKWDQTWSSSIVF